MVRRNRLVSLAVAATLAGMLAACGKGASATGPQSPGASPSGSTSSAPATSGVTIGTASVTGVGTVLVGGSGRTVYLLTADRGGKPTCTGSACTGLWPPVLLPAGVMSATAGSGVTGSMLGTVKTPSGSLQVTYNRWPLYTYSGDGAPGQANGEKIRSFGGTWYAVTASGKPATGSSTSSGAGGGYGY